MLAPAVVPALYASTEEHAPNTCYWLAMVLVALSLLVSLTLPNLERMDGEEGTDDDGCCACRCTCCADTDDDDDGGGPSGDARQLGEFTSSGGQQGRRDYTKQLAQERRQRLRGPSSSSSSSASSDSRASNRQGLLVNQH